MAKPPLPPKERRFFWTEVYHNSGISSSAGRMVYKLFVKYVEWELFKTLGLRYNVAEMAGKVIPAYMAVRLICKEGFV